MLTRALLTALATVVAVPVSGMVVVPAAFGEMVAASQTVVHGQVIDLRAFETNGRRRIETVVTLRVVDAFKGNPGETVSFRVPGGEVGRYRRVIVGAPRFARGDEVVLFLKGSAPALPVPFGLGQGVYRVVRAGDGGVTVTPLVNSEPGRLQRGDPDRRPLTLSAFATRVRALAGPRP
jgi:hypothetical protein